MSVVAREVAVDLERERVGAHERGHASVGGRIARRPWSTMAARLSAMTTFLNSPQRDQPQPASDLVAARARSRARAAAGGARRARSGRPRAAGRRPRRARSRGSSRRRLQLAAVDVDGVAERLEGVEGDAHRQDDVRQRQRRLVQEQRSETIDRTEEEVGVLEEEEHPQVSAERKPQEVLASRGVLCFVHPAPDQEVEHGREDHQADQGNAEPRVEEVARKEQRRSPEPVR